MVEKQLTSLEIKKLRQRFVSDYNLPIQVLHSPYFEERLDLFESEFGAKSEYDKLLALIRDKYDGKPNKFLEEYAKIREEIISSAKNSKAFKDFVNGDFKKYERKFPVGNVKLYTEANTIANNNYYITFDLKKANFQAIRYVMPEVVQNSSTYEDFVGNFTNLDYFKNSKYIRQVVFGQLCPKKTIIVEKYLIGKIYDFISEYFKMWGQPFSINSDEIIYKVSEHHFKDFYWNNINHLIEVFKQCFGVEVRVNKFQLHLHKFHFGTSDATLDVFEKQNFAPYQKDSFACLPIIYAPQVYKLLKCEEVTENDRTFYHEHELVTFKYPLTIDKKQEEIVKSQRLNELPF